MSRPNFQKVGEDVIENEIGAIIGPAKLARLKAEQPEVLQDFLRLGVLMTDADNCYKALEVLNSLLWRKIAWKGPVPIKFKDREARGLSPQLATVNDGEVKHHGLLSGFFKAWEGSFGFNAAQSLDMRDKGPTKIEANTVPTLTRFVNHTTFRSYLFAPGYHWKDPGVGTQHGEFTHRIQWYIVTQINLWDRFLTKQPLDIFKMFADDLCKGVEASATQTVWDAIFDRNIDPKIDFRTPEFMHAWFKETTQQEDQKVGILSQLIAGRSLKREHQAVEPAIMMQRKADDGQIKIIGKNEVDDARVESGVVFFEPNQLHAKTKANPKAQWDQSDLFPRL